MFEPGIWGLMTEAEFLRDFEEKSLSPEEFNHRRHLWLGWLYIRDYNLGEASVKLNRGIQVYAESLGADDKFHCTLTTTFACAIKSRFKENQSFDEFLNANNDLENNPMALIETHYSPEVLRSKDARKTLVAPDREPFPRDYESQLVFS